MTLRRTREAGPPRGLRRLLYRAPIALYRLGLGRMLGNRFLLLHHVGRQSGLPRQSVLEVVRRDAEGDRYIVASGFGEASDWYRNLMARPACRIEVAGRRVDVDARRLGPVDAEAEMIDYGRRNPRAVHFVAHLMGFEMEGSDADLRELAAQVPIIALRASPPPT